MSFIVNWDKHQNPNLLKYLKKSWLTRIPLDSAKNNANHHQSAINRHFCLANTRVPKHNNETENYEFNKTKIQMVKFSQRSKHQNILFIWKTHRKLKSEKMKKGAVKPPLTPMPSLSWWIWCLERDLVEEVYTWKANYFTLGLELFYPIRSRGRGGGGNSGRHGVASVNHYCARFFFFYIDVFMGRVTVLHCLFPRYRNTMVARWWWVYKDEQWKFRDRNGILDGTSWFF